MHESMFRLVVKKAAEYLLIGDRGGMADIAACQRFSENQDIRQNQIGYKAVSRPPKSGGNLVENQKNAVLIAQLSGAF